MIKIEESEGVYPPSEDSMLLLKAIEYSKGDVLDLFAGSGIIGLSATNKAEHVVLADINERAIAAIKHNAEINGIKNYEAVMSDIFKDIGDKKFDVIYMNPPYLVGKPNKNDDIDLALFGGRNGYEITLKAIKGLKTHLKKDGCAFIVLSTVYPLEKVYKALKSISFEFSTIATEKFFFEELVLIKMYDKRRNSSSE
jgi:HemK-related putative methylase